MHIPKSLSMSKKFKKIKKKRRSIPRNSRFIQDYQEESKMIQEPIKKDSLYYIKREEASKIQALEGKLYEAKLG